MFPFRDHNPSNRTPYVTWALIAANVAIFLFYSAAYPSPAALDGFFRSWGLVPRTAFAEPLGFITSQFLHAGWMHLGGNMLFLWIFGDNMEDEMGHLGFLGFYLASGVAAALAQVLSEPGSTVPMVGASGAIAGVMGGYLLLFPKARVDVLLIFIVFFKVIPLPAWLMLGFWFGLQLLGGVGSADGEGGVAYWAHAGGFLAGLALTLPLWLRLGGTAFWERTHGTPPHPEAPPRIVRTRVPASGARHRVRRSGSPWRKH